MDLTSSPRARDLVASAARAYRAHWRPLVLAAAVAFLVFDPLIGLLWLVASDPASAGIVGVVTASGSYYFDGFVAAFLADRRGGARTSTWRLLRRLPTLRLLAVDAVLLAAVTVALAAAVIPGLVLLTLFLVAGPVVVIERTGVRRAFARSRALVRGHFRPLFRLVLASVPVYVAAVTATGWLGYELAGEGYWGAYAGSFLGNVVLAPLGAVVIATTYFELRRHAEAIR